MDHSEQEGKIKARGISGKLYLLSVPIGDLEDITQKALHRLQSGNFFAVEDTRVFKLMLKKLSIDFREKKIFSFHEHSSTSKIDEIIHLLQENNDVYLVSDAGSPIISDPGFPLVRGVLNAGYEIKNIPGVTSVITALELSGLPPYPFHFYGFFPRDNSKKKEILERIALAEGTHIFFEAPLRVLDTVKTLSQNFEWSELVVVREITKKFETVYRFLARDWEAASDQIVCKGEFVVLLNISSNLDSRSENLCQMNFSSNNSIVDLAHKVLQTAGHEKTLAKLLSSILGQNSKEIYQQLITNKNQKKISI